MGLLDANQVEEVWIEDELVRLVVQPDGGYSDYLCSLLDLLLILLERIYFFGYFAVATEIASNVLITLMPTIAAYLKFSFAINVIASERELSVFVRLAVFTFSALLISHYN